MSFLMVFSFFFFFTDTATTEIYTLSLHDALPISNRRRGGRRHDCGRRRRSPCKSTPRTPCWAWIRSEEHTSELQSHSDLVCRLLLEKKKKKKQRQLPKNKTYTSNITT